MPRNEKISLSADVLDELRDSPAVSQEEAFEILMKIAAGKLFLQLQTLSEIGIVTSAKILIDSLIVPTCNCWWKYSLWRRGCFDGLNDGSNRLFSGFFSSCVW